MYRKVSESVSALGIGIKEAFGDISKPALKKIIDQLGKAPIETLKELGTAVQMKHAGKVQSGTMSKFVGLIGLLAAIASAAGADPAQVGKQIAKADTSDKVEMILDDLLNKVESTELSMRGKADLSKVNQELNDEAFKFDTRVGPTKA